MEDGYIKYQSRHQVGPAPAHKFLEELSDFRAELIGAGLVGKYKDGPGYGNVSIRVKAEAAAQSFIISATNTGALKHLAPEGYCLVESWDIETNTVDCYGPLAASSETLTHGAIYEASQTVNCVAHIHSRKLFDQLLSQGLPATPVEALYGTPELARAVAALVKARPLRGTIVMTGHEEGLISYGKSVQDVRSLICDITNLDNQT